MLKHDNPFPKKLWFFMCLQYKTLYNTVRKGLLRAFFPFSENVLFLFGKLSAIFIKFEIVVWKFFCRLVKDVSITSVTLKTFFFAESVEQDQTTHTCSLILFCTFHFSINNFRQLTLIKSLFNQFNPIPNKPWF